MIGRYCTTLFPFSPGARHDNWYTRGLATDRQSVRLNQQLQHNGRHLRFELESVPPCGDGHNSIAGRDWWWKRQSWRWTQSRYLLESAIVVAAYFLGGRLGFALPLTSGNISPVWLPSGIALAALLVLGQRVWPAIGLGAFLVNFFTPIPHVAAFGIALGNTAGPVVGASLLRRIPGFQVALCRFRDVLGLVVVGGLVGTAISATLGTSVLFLTGVDPWRHFAPAWLMWWLGDAMGVLIVTPLVVALPKLLPVRGVRTLELAALLAGAAITSLLIFGSSIGVAVGAEVLVLVLIPFLLWGAMRFELGGAAAVNLLVAAVAVWETGRGLGPLARNDPFWSAALLQTFLGLIVVPGMALATVVAERAQIVRDQAAQDRRSALDVIMLLSRAVQQTTDSIMITDNNGIIEYVNPAFESVTGFTQQEALGKTPRISKSGRQGAEFYQKLWDCISEGKPFRGTLLNRKKNGELYWGEQTITPILDDQEGITHFISVVRDVSDSRKRQEQELQLRMARDVQQRFYAPIVSVAGVDIAAAACPADETGGDYFDVISMPDKALYVGIGDISGHGLSSALVMALMRAYVRSFAELQLGVGEILTRLNRMLMADLERGQFATLLLIRIAPAHDSLTYTSAGHVPALLLNSDGEMERVLDSTGLPLGLFDHCEFPVLELALKPEQTLLLVTDGITESAAPDGRDYGASGIAEYMRAHYRESANQIVHGLCRDARAFAASEHQDDDLTSVVLKLQ